MNDDELRDYVRSRSNAELTTILSARKAQRPHSRRRVAHALHLRPSHPQRSDKGSGNGHAEELAKLAPLVAAEIAKRPQDPSLAAVAEMLGNGLSALDRFEDALAHYEEARALYTRFGQDTEAARCTMNRACMLAGLGRFQEALVGFQKAQAAASRLGQTDEASRCMTNCAGMLAGLGRFEEALAGFDAVRAVYARRGKEAEAARCMVGRANALRSLGRFQEALAGFGEAQAVSSRLGQKIEAARCMMDGACVHVDLGRFDELWPASTKREPCMRDRGTRLRQPTVR